MTSQALLRCLGALALAGLMSACTQKNSADDEAQANAAAPGVAFGVDRFLLFPNPIGTDPLLRDGGAFETVGNEYALAYYRAIDPNDDKLTLEEWKDANLFGTTGNGTLDTLVVFRDVKDLGYGRRMTGRRNTSFDPRVDGNVAFYVENYKVTPGASVDYSSEFNVEAAIRRDAQWHVGTNAIEWSPADCSAAELAEGCNANVKFAKYYNFSSVDGTRQLTVDLDGRGKKAMPGPCITCHGGRADPLTPPDASGKPRFPLVENTLSRKRGDVQGRLEGQNVDSFGFSNQPGFTKAEQQAKLKDFNKWVLCTYPSPTLTPGLTVTGTSWGPCIRPTAGANEWQGTAGPMIEAWYSNPGANDMLNPAFADNYVPAGWSTNTVIAGTTFTDTDLYNNVVKPYCRTCHIVRGTANGTDGDFMTLLVPAAVGPPATVARGFQTSADRIKVHVFDRGNMPLALIPHTDFWNSQAPKMLAAFVDAPAQLGPGSATSASGAVLMPGRPIANPGPDRMVKTSAIAKLSAADSLFAQSYTWALDPGGQNASITPTEDPAIAHFSSGVASTTPYTVRLTVGNGVSTDSKLINITVNDAFPDPVKFAHVKNVLQNVVHGTAKCVLCHVAPPPLPPLPTPPIFFNNFDRDGIDGTTPTTTDEAWFLKALAGRVNLTEIEASSLLRKPSGKHHRGGKSFDVTTAAGLSSYSILYNWILAGMPPGGVAADAVVNNGVLGTAASPVLFTFTGPVGGPYAPPAINLVGSTSIGATSYAWTVIGPPGPLPSIASPTSAVTTLSVFNVGTYVIQLQVSDGTSTDTVQRTLVVGENPIAASFTPATGTTQVTFSGSPVRGSITLNSTSTGSPTTCRWQILSGPLGATLGAFPALVIDSTQSCASPATLSVPASAAGGLPYSVRLTASNVASSVADNLIGVAAAPGQNAANADFTPPASSISFTINSNLNGPTTTRINGSPTSSITLNGSATGLAPLTYTWSLPSGAGSAGCASPASGQITSLTVTKAGTCDVMLTVSNGLPGTSTVTKTVTISSAVIFSNVANLLTNAFCTGCHGAAGPSTPSLVNDAGLHGRLTTTSGVVSTGSPRSSLLLVCPASGCTVTNTITGLPQSMLGSQTSFGLTGDFSGYDTVLTWITNGATNP